MLRIEPAQVLDYCLFITKVFYQVQINVSKLIFHLLQELSKNLELEIVCITRKEEECDWNQIITNDCKRLVVLMFGIPSTSSLDLCSAISTWFRDEWSFLCCEQRCWSGIGWKQFCLKLMISSTIFFKFLNCSKFRNQSIKLIDFFYLLIFCLLADLMRTKIFFAVLVENLNQFIWKWDFWNQSKI